MPQLNVYVDRDLEREVKRWGLPVSTICQRALARQARIAEKRAQGLLPARPATRDADTPDGSA